MAITKITSNDIPLICEWHKEHAAINFPDSKYKRNLFKESLKKGIDRMRNGKAEVMVKLVDGEKMVGFLWLIKEFDIFKDLYYCDLHYIQVDTGHRGMGLGGILMREAERWAVAGRMKEIRLGTDAGNLPAISLYEKRGFIKKRIIFEKKLCPQTKK